MKTEQPRGRRASEAGFTLVEALTSVVVLVFGIMGVTNLLIIGTKTNQTANQGSAATAVASELMESLKAKSWPDLTAGLPLGTAGSMGSLTADVGAVPLCGVPALPCGCAAAVVASNPAPAIFVCESDIPGVGRIHARWQITSVLGQAQMVVVSVRAEAVSNNSVVHYERTRAEFTSFRSCTLDSSVTNSLCPVAP